MFQPIASSSIGVTPLVAAEDSCTGAVVMCSESPVTPFTISPSAASPAKQDKHKYIHTSGNFFEKCVRKRCVCVYSIQYLYKGESNQCLTAINLLLCTAHKLQSCNYITS